MSKKSHAKVIQISDILQWHDKKEIELSPKYQRNSVWNEKAKSYLIDTIIRGLPIPPIFIRQQVDVITRKTFREVIDGQQRLRAILEFTVDESFVIKKSHNKEYGNKKYSELDTDIQQELLEYEIVSEVISEKDDSIIYDMFARLNSNNYVLNRQEIRNSKYWGEFKVYIYRIASVYREFFIKNTLMCDAEFSRMHDIELVTSLNLAIMDGIVAETPTSIDKLYEKYDKEFLQLEDIENKFCAVMSIVSLVYNYFNKNIGCFTNKNYFFTLYCVILNQMYGITNSNLNRLNIYNYDNINSNIHTLYGQITNFIIDFDHITSDNSDINYHQFIEFKNYHKSRTTSKLEREKRITFLNNQLGSNINVIE